jgi:NAD-dependent DNA ligase
MGGITIDAVTRKTTILIVKDLSSASGTVKYQKALQLKIPIYDLATFNSKNNI